MSKTMSINIVIWRYQSDSSLITLIKWRSDFNLSEGLKFQRAGQASPPLGRSVAHHSKRPIHPIYSQLFSRERERDNSEIFMTLWLWFIWFCTMEKRVRERRRGFVSGWVSKIKHGRHITELSEEKERAVRTVSASWAGALT